MTNEEVYQCAYDEIKSRGLSPNTAEGYLGELTVFLRYFDNRPIETMTWDTFPIAGGARPRFRAMELSKVMRSLPIQNAHALSGGWAFFLPNFG